MSEAHDVPWPKLQKGALGVLSATAAICVAGLAAAAAPPTPTGPGSLAGMWANAAYKGSEHYSARERMLMTQDGKTPPLATWAQTLLDQRLKDSDDGRPFANTLALCLPGGMPEMLFGASYPVQILETPGQVTMLFDEQNHFRVIRMNQPHLPDPDPSYMGDSVGHWEDGALVVDTIALTERTTLDQVGTPHSEALHLVERYRRTGPDRMEVLVTVDDPKAFTRSWQAKAVYKMASPDTQMEEYICENNRNLPDASGRQGFQGARR